MEEIIETQTIILSHIKINLILHRENNEQVEHISLSNKENKMKRVMNKQNS